MVSQLDASDRPIKRMEQSKDEDAQREGTVAHAAQNYVEGESKSAENHAPILAVATEASAPNPNRT
jgi:hypothetical protein